MSLLLAFLAACASDPAETGAALPDTGEPAAMVYESAASCGECHPRQQAEWQESMHRYAARSPVFDAMAAKAYRDSAGELGGFCTGCHSPFGEEQGLGGGTVTADRDAMALEGVSCDYCHTAVGHDAFVGNNQILNEPGMVKQGPYADAVATAHTAEQSAFLTSPELCGSCHDVYKYPGIEIEQAYTEYLESPAAEAGLTCQDCHMSPDPGLPSARPWGPSAEVPGETYPDREQASHRFIGPDYALIDDYPYPDDLEASAEAQAAQLERVQALLEAAVRLGGVEARLDGDQLLVEVVLESLTIGHRVPTGFTSERQLWVELAVSDASGEVFYRTGDLDADGNLRDRHSSRVQAGEVEEDVALVNLQSRNMVLVRQYNANGALSQEDGVRDEYETIFPFDANFIERQSLEPLEQRAVTWAVRLAGRPGPYSVQARLHYRNLPPYVLQALLLDDLVERLHVFTLDELTVQAP